MMLERMKNISWKDVDWKKLNYPKIALTAVFLLAMFLLGRAVGAATQGVMATSAIAQSPENWGLGFGQEGSQPPDDFNWRRGCCRDGTGFWRYGFCQSGVPADDYISRDCIRAYQQYHGFLLFPHAFRASGG